MSIQIASAEPMPTPALDEAVQRSERIVVATYRDYARPRHSVNYFSKIQAQYTINRILKGPALPKTIEIQYAFDDGSACLPPQDWRFNPRQDMPAKGSRWILFLLPKDTPRQKTFKTYRGTYGRWPADGKSLALINQAMKR